MSRSADLFEVCKLYYDRGDFLLASQKLQEASQYAYQEKKLDLYLECLNFSLRCFVETDNSQKINEIREKLQNLVLKDGFQLTSRTYYTLGMCASFKEQHDLALEYLKKALNLALNEVSLVNQPLSFSGGGNSSVAAVTAGASAGLEMQLANGQMSDQQKKHVCYAINGIAMIYMKTNRLQEALKEIYNLQIFLQVLDLPEVRMSTQFINGHILRKTKRYEQALDIFWNCYETLKQTKNIYHYVYLLFSIGITYEEAGDINLAHMYLKLAQRTVDGKNMVVMARQIEAHLVALNKQMYTEYDLVYTKDDNMIIEKNMGKVDFKNQFVLLDLLKLFLRHPGKVFNKETLVGEVWKQEYDPSIHDNKIYVTIKRLRQMIEPNYEKPKYIFRAKNGYFFNNQVRVLVEESWGRPPDLESN